MPINSRAKGKAGELELADYLRDRGVGARRGQQFHGGAGSPDVVTTLQDIHFECKRVESGSLYDWLAQAQRDAGDAIPVVAHRRNRKEWVAILPLDKFLELVKNGRPSE
jgi:Holliday junction resolvase